MEYRKKVTESENRKEGEGGGRGGGKKMSRYPPGLSFTFGYRG